MPEKFTTRTIPKVMFANCGHGITRRLKDCAKLNFISAGQGQFEGRRPFYFSNQIRNLIERDILAVYRNEVGYVGIARVISKPMTVLQAFLSGQKVTNDMFSPEANMFRNAYDPCFAECLVEVEWLTGVYTESKHTNDTCFGIFGKQHATCSLDNQIYLKQKLQRVHNLDFDELLTN